MMSRGLHALVLLLLVALAAAVATADPREVENAE